MNNPDIKLNSVGGSDWGKSDWEDRKSQSILSR
jgi:hypothetical protein